MEDNKKISYPMDIFLLVVCCGLIMYGIWGPAYDWFTGPRLVTLFALGAMFAKLLEMQGNLPARHMCRACAVIAMVGGSHLLTPYFWPGRISNMTVFVTFIITAIWLWYSLGYQTVPAQRLCPWYKMFCSLPVFLAAASIMAAKMTYGYFCAPMLLAMLYLLVGIALVREGVKTSSRWTFNAGLGLFCLILAAAILTFFFNPPNEQQIGLMAGLVLILNLFFNKVKGE